MCGICGIVFTDRTREPSAVALAHMAETLRFRGPDAEGFHIRPGIGLGHRRLRVIDLEGGKQPMSDPGGQVTISLNGEVYNFQSLRAVLQAEGTTFRTSSDTEVLLQGYLRWGIGVLDRLVGMFAFAIWDARDETLWLARDRLGVKPLYWARLPDDGLVFGSELAAVAASGLVPIRLNTEALARYLSLGYVIGDQSILAGIERLPPATVLRWRRGQELHCRTYWDLAGLWSQRDKDRGPGRDLQERFAAHLYEAVSQRLVSDVPLGAFLSGGLDSSTVTALMLRHHAQVDTFSVGFLEKSYDELPWARRVALALGTRHHDEVVRCDTPELLLEVSGHQDEPFADTSILPTYRLCQTARKKVTVALGGDGGDELLAGYVTHQANRLRGHLQRAPRSVLRLARWAVSYLPDSRRKVNALFKAKQFVAGCMLDPCDAHASWRMLATRQHLARLLGRDRESDIPDPFEPFRQAYRQAKGLQMLDQSLYVDYKTWLVDDILVKADRASMSHGLEVRSPFLDHRLVEFCMSVPAEMKLRRGKGKQILRQVARNLVPACAIRRRKAGFNAPVSDWLCGSWRELVEDHFSAPALASTGIVSPQVVRGMLGDHLSGRRDHGYFLFTLLMLGLWLRRVRPKLS